MVAMVEDTFCFWWWDDPPAAAAVDATPEEEACFPLRGVFPMIR
jgi:hypothetical protein